MCIFNKTYKIVCSGATARGHKAVLDTADIINDTSLFNSIEWKTNTIVYVKFEYFKYINNKQILISNTL